MLDLKFRVLQVYIRQAELHSVAGGIASLEAIRIVIRQFV